jgi:hypothetical protein
MELVPGGSLAARLEKTGPVPWREAALLGAGIARGLAAIHSAGFVHRDVKPGNVLVGPEGEPKIADFGLSRSLDPGAERLTLTSESVGTVAFMAPEQAEGGEATAASDLYGLGATIHALVSGQAPFASGPAISVLKKKLLEPPPRLQGVPRALEDLVARCMAADPAARGESAAAVARRLEEIAKDGPERRPLLPVVAAAIAVAASIFVIARPGRRALPATEPTATVRKHPAEAPPDGPSAPPSLARLWLGLDPAQVTGHGLELVAVFDVTRRDAPSGISSLAAGSELAVAGTGSGTIAVFRPGDQEPRVEWRGHSSPVVGVALTTDATKILSAGQGGGTYLWQTTGPENGKPLWQVRPRERNARGATITTDQKTAAIVTREGNVWTFDLASGTRRSDDHVGYGLLGVAPLDGGRVAACDANGRFLVWDTAREGGISGTWAVLDHHEKDVGPRVVLATTPGGDLLTVSRGEIHLTRNQAEGRLFLDPPGLAPVAAALSPGAERALVADESGKLRIFDFSGPSRAREETVHLPPTHAATSLVWLPDGRSFLVGTRDGLVLRFVMASRPH